MLDDVRMSEDCGVALILTPFLYSSWHLLSLHLFASNTLEYLLRRKQIDCRLLPLQMKFYLIDVACR